MLKEGETKMEKDEKEQFRVQGKRWRTNIKYAYLNSNIRIEKHSSKLSVYAKKVILPQTGFFCFYCFHYIKLCCYLPFQTAIRSDMQE